MRQTQNRTINAQYQFSGMDHYTKDK